MSTDYEPSQAVSTTGETDMMKLYEVTTVADEYGGCKSVTFSWFRGGRTDRPYAELIKDYDPDDKFINYAESAIDDLFTAIEANALKDYLDRQHGECSKTTITEAELPIPNNLSGYSAMAVGGGDDFYVLHGESSYSLPFKVEGYFNLVGCELADESGETFRHYLILVSPDGVRRQTQEEARKREVRGQ